LAIVMPLLLILTTAIFTFGIAMNNYQMLTHGVNQGGLLLQELRSMPGASDPCLAVANAVIAAAPNLSSSGANGLQLTVQLDNGAVSYGPVSASSATCTAGAAYLSQSTQGTNVTVTATYSCNLTIFGVNYAPSCVLSSSTTEQMQ
jgi:Flp pilus assembly protein TadG